MRKLFAFLLILTWMCMRMHIQAQTYTMLSSGNSTITTCSGVIYDPGGTGDYPSNCDSYLTIYPGSGGSKVRLTGTYNTEGTTYAWDYFNVYDGTSNTGTQLGSFHGLGTCDVISLTGPLTIYFHSDGSVQHAGFELNVSCCTDVCACSSPTGVHIRTGNQFIKVLWDPSMLTNGYFLEYGPHGFTPGAGSRTYTSATSYTLNNLINDTEYDIYIWFDCGNDHRITTELPVMVSATPGSNCTMTSGTREFEICNGFVYDNGGPTGNYSNYSNDTLIIYPATNGCKVSIVGTYYTESASFDYIKIYDGAGVAGTMLGKFAETGTITEPIYSTSPDGTLTVVFHSDGSVQKSGYEFQVACICYVDHVQDTVCYKERYQNHGFDTSLAYSGDYTLIRVANSTLIDVDLHVRPSPYVSIAGRYYFCADGDITLTANNAVSYAWSTGEHSQSIHVHDIGSYQVTITDSHGCVASASHRIAPIDEFIDMIDFPTMCAGKDYLITGSYESGSEILMHRVQSTLSSVDTAFLPDGIACDPYGCSYRSTLTFTDYSSNAYVRDANDIYYVKINMEHSYIGDIYINITCPTGQKADIMRWSGSGSTECNSQIPTSATGWQSGDNYMYAYFGQAYDYQDYNDYCDRNSSSNAPGIGWNYCWSNNTTQGFVYAATPGSLVYRSANVHAGIVDSSDVAGGTQFYHPDQAFSSLVGCPLNGDWYIEVVDGYGADNGYIFGWELALTEELLPNNTFNVSEITPVGPWIAGMTSDTSFTISPPGTLQEDTTVQYLLHFYDSDNCSYDTLVRVSVNTLHYGDTVASACESFTWHGVTYTQSGSYNDTLQTSAGCDSIVTLHLTIDTPPDPPTVSPSTLICPGDMVTLTAECEDAFLLTEGFSSITDGGDENASAPGSDTIHCNTLATFPIMSYVYPAGGKVKFGKGSYANTAISGSMTSVPLNLSRPFKVVVRAKNWTWGGQTGGNVDGTLVITAGSQTLTQTVNTSQYSDYTFNFNAAGLTPITIASNLPGWRLIIDSVYITMEKECAYTWSASPSTEILPDIHAQSITAHPEETTTFTLHQTSNSCTLDTSITVSVVPPPTITGGGFICEGESVTLTAECPDLVVLEEDFSMCTTVNANILNGDIPTFPVTDKVRTDTDTGSVILGIGGMGTTTTGEITSIPLDLTSDFKVTVRARKKNNDVEMYVVVGSETRHQTVASTDFADYEFDFTGQPGWGQETIHIYNELPGGSVVNGLKRLSITDVQIQVEPNCTYTWTASPALTITDPHAQSITVSPAETTVFTLTQTTDNCTQNVAQTVTVSTPNHQSYTIETCESYTWASPQGDGQTYSASGDYLWSHNDSNGCLQVDTLHLIINQPVTTTTSATACESYTWNGQTYTLSDEYTQTFTASNGCDSVVTLNLTVNVPTTGVDEREACDHFTWIDGVTYMENNNTATYTLTNAAGCDSVVTLHLTINEPTTGDTTAVECDSFDWYENTNLTQSGDYTHVFAGGNANGCDSTVTLHLTINEPTTGDTTAVECDSFDWYENTNLTQSGDYTHVFAGGNAAGCDSIVTLHLTINEPTTGDTTAVECGHFDWYERSNLTQSGDYTHVFVGGNANGCDSTVTLHLTINEPTTGDTTAVECGHFDWYDHTNITESGDYKHVFVGGNANGCDSTVTLHLTINEPTTGDTTAVECERFDWYEHENLTRSGDYTHVFVGGNANGCDSILTLHLTIHEPTTGDTTAVECDSFDWYENTTLTQSGDYTHVFAGGNAAGCDSIVTLHLTIHESTASIDERQSCGEFTWIDGNTYSESTDTPTVTLASSTGCDSVVTLHLTIKEILTSIDRQESCGAYTWINDVTYTASTDTPTCTLTSSTGCDSIVTLHLTINEPTTGDTTAVECGRFDWYNHTNITESGDYTHVFVGGNANGCDSVVVLHLLIQKPDTIRYDRTVCKGTRFQEYGFDTLMTTSGTYLLTRTLYAQLTPCDTLVELTLHVTEPVVVSTVAQSVCPSSNSVVVVAQFQNLSGDNNAVIWTSNNVVETHDNLVTPLHPKDSFTLQIPLNLCDDSLFYTVEYSDGICMVTETNFIHVVDTVPPAVNGVLSSLNLIGCSEDDVPSAFTNASEINALENISIADNCTSMENITIQHSDSVVSASCDISMVRIYTLTDICGNATRLMQDITLVRTSDFTISQVDTADTVICFSMALAENFTLPEVQDACGLVLQPSSDSPTVSGLDGSCEGSVRYAYTYRNCSGGYTVWTFTYHVALPDSFTSFPANGVGEAQCLADVFPPTPPVVEDACGNTLNVTSLGSTENLNPDGSGTVDFLFRYSDCAGNDSVWTYTYTLTPNQFTPKPDLYDTVYCVSEALDDTVPVVTNCGIPVALTHGVDTNRVEDGCGDMAYVYNYTVNDVHYTWTHYYHVAPVPFVLPANQECFIQCLDSAVQVDPPVVVNTCSDTIVPIALPVGIHSDGCSGYVTYAWDYADCSGSTARWTYTYVVADTTPPTFIVPADMVICRDTNGAYDADPAVTGIAIRISDNCSSLQEIRNSCQETLVEGANGVDTLLRQWIVKDNCDNENVQTQRITIMPVRYTTVVDSICEGEVYDTLNFNFVANVDTVVYLQLSSHETRCDSLITLNLTVFHPVNESDSVTTIDEYTWNGITYAQSGMYTHHHPDIHGCDQVDTLYLTIHYPSSSDIYDTACDSYTWNGVDYTESGVYTQHFTNEFNVDSTVVLHLVINHSKYTTIYDTVCYTYEWNGVVYTETGVYEQYFLTSDGCDSIVTLELRVNYNKETNIQEIACEEYTWYDVTYTESGIYTKTLESSDLCDSTVILYLTINHDVSSEWWDTVCNVKQWNDEFYTESGEYVQHFESVLGCDSAVTLHLVMNHSDTTVFDATGCDTYTWENIEYAQSGEYTRTFTNQFGCDSMVTMRLTIHSATYSTLYDTITQNSLPYDTLGMHFTEAGTKKDTILNQYGCDSIITMHLFVAQNVVVEVDSTICENDLPFTWNHVVFNQAGTMNDTLTAANGSDSIVVMTLNVVFNTYSVENEFVIENNLPHVFNGHTFTGPITNEQIVIPNANGCDSIITYSLQVWYNVKDTVERTICENDLPYSWNNVPFSAPGMQNAVFTLPNGADSVLTMVLFVHNNTQSTIYDTIVENGLPYDTLDMHFADAGTLSDTIANTNGCDSIVTMHLYVWYNVANTVDSTVCENNLPIVWNDVVFEAAGENTIVLVGNHGVDSALTMRLAVIPKDVSVFHDEVCEGRDYFGHGFVVPGNQTVHIPAHHLSIENTFENELGCDSIVHLELDIVDTTVYIRPLFDFCDNMSTTLSVYTQMTDYVWSTGETSQNIDVTAPGLYSVTAMQGDCQSEAVVSIEDCPTEIYLPNAITPGKLDGHNDCFSLPERCQNMIDEFEITIFNRWGQPVFHSKDKAFKWYGEYKDNVYRQNVYEYLIDYTENNRFHRKVKLRGSVVVL